MTDHPAEADFSSVIQRRKKRPQYYPPATFETTTYALGSGTGYQTSGGGLGPGDEEPWTSVSGAKEQPVDKFRRLRYEMEELEKELEDSAGARSSKQAEGDAKSEESAAPDGLMDQLSSLRAQLTTMEERNLHGLPSSSWHIETKRLLERLSTQDDPTERHKGDLGGQVQTEGKIDTAAVGGAARYAELDKRLAGLEELIGVKDTLVDEVSRGRDGDSASRLTWTFLAPRPRAFLVRYCPHLHASNTSSLCSPTPGT